MNDYIKLSTAPRFTYNNPTCNACGEEVETADEGWMCNYCGTYWYYKDTEDTPGELYESWSGEELAGEALDPDDWQAVYKATRELQQRRADEL